MRSIIKPFEPSAIPISDIQFDPQSRDDIPQVLRGLQYIYANPDYQKAVFDILETIIPPHVDKNNGRPSMALWTILVMGVLRWYRYWDYDRLLEMVNNHQTIRQMLGHASFEYVYKSQTIKDNVSLLTPEILEQINQVVVNAGHQLFKKKDDILNGRCDSFVVETDVHYPTFTTLLFDAIRTIILLIAKLCKKLRLEDCNDHIEQIKEIKNSLHRLQRLKHSTSKDEEKKKKQEQVIIDAHQSYLNLVKLTNEQVNKTLKMLVEQPKSIKNELKAEFSEIQRFIEHAERQIDQIDRRVIKGEQIPHDEKVFSLFEEHTEWVSKGKAGVPVELGLKVCISSSQIGFILHHHVMQKQTDDKVAITMVEETQKRLERLRSCSFDKGCNEPSNQKVLIKLLDFVCLPKKGKLSKKDQELEYSEEFRQNRRKHSAVESAINALEVHGLDICPDHGIDGFKRYVALAVVARNLQHLGALLQKQEREQQLQIEAANQPLLQEAA
jgi:hypothetical protein